MKLSVVIPAHNEEGNIEKTYEELKSALDARKIEFEIVVVDDNSSDSTPAILAKLQQADGRVRPVRRNTNNGFGRAVREGIANVKGDVVVIYMADLSDDPQDVIRYYDKILEGYDCVFGSRFMKGGQIVDYPKFKLVVNRIVNFMLSITFFTSHNDLTNAFKAYRTHVLDNSGPFKSSHFNITIEMSLSALIRNYKI
ncbi:MAG: glycosyltransferase family 2 protein, partial [Planctomycetes bacterium]|nr:glycosyltransferase family 2 protein [Planctomycetota bacterium]